MFKNPFLVCFGLLVFVSDTSMRKNRFLVCFALLVFVYDVSWCILGCWFTFVLRLCMSMSSSLQNNHFLRGLLCSCFSSLLHVCMQKSYSMNHFFIETTFWFIFVDCWFPSLRHVCKLKSYLVNHLGQ